MRRAHQTGRREEPQSSHQAVFIQGKSQPSGLRVDWMLRHVIGRMAVSTTTNWLQQTMSIRSTRAAESATVKREQAELSKIPNAS